MVKVASGRTLGGPRHISSATRSSRSASQQQPSMTQVRTSLVLPAWLLSSRLGMPRHISPLVPLAPRKHLLSGGALGSHSPRRSRSRSRSRQEEARAASRPRCQACDCPDCAGAATGACPKYLDMQGRFMPRDDSMPSRAEVRANQEAGERPPIVVRGVVIDMDGEGLRCFYNSLVAGMREIGHPRAGELSSVDAVRRHLSAFLRGPLAPLVRVGVAMLHV